MHPSERRQTVAETLTSEAFVEHDDCRFNIDRFIGSSHGLEGHCLDGPEGFVYLYAVAHRDRLLGRAARMRGAQLCPQA
jgi:hypothetical protein